MNKSGIINKVRLDFDGECLVVDQSEILFSAAERASKASHSLLSSLGLDSSRFDASVGDIFIDGVNKK